MQYIAHSLQSGRETVPVQHTMLKESSEMDTFGLNRIQPSSSWGCHAALSEKAPSAHCSLK